MRKKKISIKNKKRRKNKMQPQMMGMPQPKANTWEEIIEQLKIQISNTEKNLLMTKSQLTEAESHIEKKEE